MKIVAFKIEGNGTFAKMRRGGGSKHPPYIYCAFPRYIVGADMIRPPW